MPSAQRRVCERPVCALSVVPRTAFLALSEVAVGPCSTAPCVPSPPGRVWVRGYTQGVHNHAQSKPHHAS